MGFILILSKVDFSGKIDTLLNFRVTGDPRFSSKKSVATT
jgi:hypothetical protein